MDRSSLVVAREHEYKEILLVGFITCKTINYKYLRTNLLERGYYDMAPRGEYMGVYVYVIGVGLIKGPRM
jgi:hypothetical protein